MRNEGTFEGTFEDGKRHGHGVLVDEDGNKLEGTWTRGRREGRARFHRKVGEDDSGQALFVTMNVV